MTVQLTTAEPVTRPNYTTTLHYVRNEAEPLPCANGHQATLHYEVMQYGERVGAPEVVVVSLPLFKEIVAELRTGREKRNAALDTVAGVLCGRACLPAESESKGTAHE